MKTIYHKVTGQKYALKVSKRDSSIPVIVAIFHGEGISRVWGRW